MPGTKMRPNSNTILDMMRDGDMGDLWATTISMTFSACDVLYDADPNMVPAELEYRPSFAGPEVPNGGEGVHRITLEDLSYETVMLWCWLHNVDADDDTDPSDLPYWTDPTFAARVEELRAGLVMLGRYLEWLRAAGMSY